MRLFVIIQSWLAGAVALGLVIDLKSMTEERIVSKHAKIEIVVVLTALVFFMITQFGLHLNDELERIDMNATIKVLEKYGTEQKYLPNGRDSLDEVAHEPRIAETKPATTEEPTATERSAAQEEEPAAQEEEPARTGYDFDQMRYVSWLDAYVAAEPQGEGTKYTIVRHDEQCDLDRVVTAFCLTPNWNSYGETGCATKYIYYDFVPYHSSDTVWRMCNNYGFGSKLADDLKPGEILHSLTMGKDSLELDYDMLDTIHAALDGYVTWPHTEYGAYMDADGVLNLDDLLKHFGYHYAGTQRDVPRGGLTEDYIVGNWTVWADGRNTVMLMADKSEIFWVSCVSGNDWNVTDVPMQLFDDEFQTTAILNGKSYKVSNRVLGVLIQYLQYEHYYSYDVLTKAPVSEKDWQR